MRRIEFYELPKTISGKIRRVELRQREMHAFTDGVSPSCEFREEDFEETQIALAKAPHTLSRKGDPAHSRLHDGQPTRNAQVEKRGSATMGMGQG